jgi:hypothetical protein
MVAQTKTPRRIDKAWYAAYPMQAKLPLEQRIDWRRAHAHDCGCRPVPQGLQQWLQPRVARD